jgi:phage RecT family recombinase
MARPNQQIQKTENRNAIQRAAQFLVESQDKIENYLPPKVDRDRFLTSVFLAFDENEKLQKALETPKGKSSVMSALRRAACKGLSCNPQEGLAGFIVYDDKIEYRVFAQGMVELALRDGHVKEMRSRAIYENDEFELGEDANGDYYRLKREIKNPGEISGFLAVAKLNDGTIRCSYMTAEQAHRWGDQYGMRRRDGKLSPMWRDSFEGAGQKTVVRKLLSKLHIAIPGIDDDEESVAAYVEEAKPEPQRQLKGHSSQDITKALTERIEEDQNRETKQEEKTQVTPNAVEPQTAISGDEEIF